MSHRRSHCSISRSWTPASADPISAQLAHLIEAWEAAVTGSEAPFELLASEEAREALLAAGSGATDRERRRLQSWEPTRLELCRESPAIEVSVEVSAVRYVVQTTMVRSLEIGSSSSNVFDVVTRAQAFNWCPLVARHQQQSV